MPAVGSVNVRISATTMGLTKGLSSASSSLMSFNSSVMRMATGAGVAAMGLFGLQKGFDVISSSIERASNMEQAEIAFGVLFKSVDTAKTVLSGLSTFAAETPFELPELTQAAKSLAAFGISAKDVVPELRMLGDISAGIGAPITEIATLYGKAKVQGRLFAKDINELTGRGIPVIGALAKQFGVAEKEVQKLVTEGKVGFPEIQKAFQSMTGAGGQFEKLMEKQSQSLGGIWSTLKDNIGLTLSGIATDLIAAFDVKTTLKQFIGVTGWVKDSIKSLTPIIQTVASVFSSAWSLISAGAGALFGGLMSRVPVTFATIVTSVKKAGAWINSTFEAIKPIVSATGAFIAASWAAIGSGALWVFNYVYEVASSWFTNISTIFSNLTGITGVTFEGIKLFMIDALILGEFLFNNFADVSALAFEKTKLAAVTMFADIGHFFTGVIPTWFNWFSENWRDVFFTAFDLATTVFINLGTNIRKMFASLWDYIKSGFTTSFEINWTPLTEGAVNAVKKLPEIPARAVTELEQKLKNNVGRMGDNLGQKLGDHMVKRREELLGKPPEMPARVNVTGTEVNTGPSGMASATPAAVAKKPVEGVAALNRGSGDATSAILKAMRGAPVQEKILKVAEKQLTETKKVAKSLDTMTSGDGLTFVAGEVPA